jgi:hypothetical protein
MAHREKHHTGEKIEVSGIYHVVGTNDEITLVKGDRVPPYDGDAAKVWLARKTNNEENRR